MSFDINSPEFNDNRNYNYSPDAREVRKEYRYFVDAIPAGSSVLDLGCGDGTLMEILAVEKKCEVTGIELSESGVRIGKNKGLNVLQGRIDERLPFEDNSFDYAICNTTIQMVMYPEVLLREMMRVAPKQIVSFPNFAFYKNRMQLFFGGKMPAHCLFGYEWYNTGHIHQLSCSDFRELVSKISHNPKIKILNRATGSSPKDYLINTFPDLFHIFPVYFIGKND